MYSSINEIYNIEIKNEFAWIQFNRPKDANPFSRKLTQCLINILPQLEADESIKGIVLTGGLNRSFSTGGDFNDVSALKHRHEVEIYLGEIIDLYQHILRVSKPVLSLIDHYAIGQGLQVSLMSDWKMATRRAKISMPELKNGVACPLGSLILETLLGRSQMLKDVIGCSMLTTDDPRIFNYFDQIIEVDNFYSDAEAWINKIKNYPIVPYRMTKKIHNQRFIEKLESVRNHAIEAHVQSTLVQSGQEHFQRILSKNSGLS